MRSFLRRNRSPQAPAPIAPDDRFPPAVTVDYGAAAKHLFHDRVRQSVFDTYAGVPMLKFPEDLRVYEHLLWSASVEVVVELGVQQGGSALWFRDRLRTLATYGRITRPRVIGVDIDLAPARAHLAGADRRYAEEIALIEGDVCDPATADRVRGLVPPGSSCLVIEDSAHIYDTTLAALNAFSGLVRPGGSFVVEDGCVDAEELRVHPDWPRGVLPAVHEWLDSPAGSHFRQRRDLELYGV